MVPLTTSFELPESYLLTLRTDQLEVKIGLSWGKSGGSSTNLMKSKSRLDLPNNIAQEIHLPLHFSSVEVYSGLAPPPSWSRPCSAAARAARGKHNPPGRPQVTRPQTVPSQAEGPPAGLSAQSQRPPALPHRPAPQQAVQQPADALYPPQLRDGDVPLYDDAPPSYDEAMAESTGPVFPTGAARPAYSGMTNENGPSMMNEKH